MPTHRRDDGTPIVLFDVLTEISPFVLFRRLDEGRAPLLVDVRTERDGRTLAGAEHRPDPGWSPPGIDDEVVLFDNDGSEAVEYARRLQAAGYGRVKALFGGLDLYQFSLDPELLESDTYLVIEP